MRVGAAEDCVSRATGIDGVGFGAADTGGKLVGEAFEGGDSQYRLLFESNPIPMWVFHRETLRFLAVNQAAMRQYGYSEAEFLGMTIADIRPADTVVELLQDVARRRHGLQEPGLWKHRRKDGVIVDVEVVCHDLEFQRTEAMLVAAYDVTAREQAQEAARQAEEQYRAIFDNAVIGIFQHSPDGRPLNINRAFAEMHGYESAEALLAEISNAAVQLFVDPRQMMEVTAAAARDGIVRGAEIELYRKDRSRFWVMVNLRAVHDRTGQIVTFEGTAEDITNRKAAEAQVNYLAYHDALTGLPNRTLFMDRLENALAGARRKDEKLAVLFLDLDRFKNINDSLGHSFGDQMLKVVAERLKECVRAQDTVARVGGDEFLILLSEMEHEGEPSLAAQRILHAMGRTFVVHGRAVSTSCSVGVSMFPEHGADGETLIKNADAAMYCAKDDGAGKVRVFASAMNSATVAQLTLENDLRTALEAGEFFLEYQPQMEIATGRITGIEALLRWQHPALGLVPPDRFIPIAENSGLILAIGEWVVRTACVQAKEWRSRGLGVAPVSVNVSALQFRQDGFSGLIRRALQESGLPPEYLELELTESVLLSSGDVMRTVLEELKAMGVALAIDDFGIGYSSLSYLKQFRAGKLKIDRSFIRDVVTDGEDATLTKAIIRMGRSLGMRVVAEGVETEAQLAFLREQGCDEIQGYYFSDPIGSGAMAALLGCVSSAFNEVLQR